MSKLTKILQPAIKFLFPELKNNEQAKEEISMNVVANLLGLGKCCDSTGIKKQWKPCKRRIPKKTL